MDPELQCHRFNVNNMGSNCKRSSFYFSGKAVLIYTVLPQISGSIRTPTGWASSVPPPRRWLAKIISFLEKEKTWCCNGCWIHWEGEQEKPIIVSEDGQKGANLISGQGLCCHACRHVQIWYNLITASKKHWARTISPVSDPHCRVYIYKKS